LEAVVQVMHVETIQFLQQHQQLLQLVVDQEELFLILQELKEAQMEDLVVEAVVDQIQVQDLRPVEQVILLQLVPHKEIMVVLVVTFVERILVVAVVEVQLEQEHQKQEHRVIHLLVMAVQEQQQVLMDPQLRLQVVEVQKMIFVLEEQVEQVAAVTLVILVQLILVVAVEEM
jgi:hypothetical protein